MAEHRIPAYTHKNQCINDIFFSQLIHVLFGSTEIPTLFRFHINRNAQATCRMQFSTQYLYAWTIAQNITIQLAISSSYPRLFRNGRYIMFMCSSTYAYYIILVIPFVAFIWQATYRWPPSLHTHTRAPCWLCTPPSCISCENIMRSWRNKMACYFNSFFPTSKLNDTMFCGQRWAAILSRERKINESILLFCCDRRLYFWMFCHFLCKCYLNQFYRVKAQIIQHSLFDHHNFPSIVFCCFRTLVRIQSILKCDENVHKRPPATRITYGLYFYYTLSTNRGHFCNFSAFLFNKFKWHISRLLSSFCVCVCLFFSISSLLKWLCKARGRRNNLRHIYMYAI